MILGVCGYGYTGSGAVLDFLREFPSCSVSPYDFEFSISYIPHGIQDLENALVEQCTRFFSSDVAIKEFYKLIEYYNTRHGIYRRLSGEHFRQHAEEFLKKIIQVEWSGYSWDDAILASPLRLTARFRLLSRWINFYESHTDKRYKLPKSDRIYLSVCPDRFEESVREFLKNVLADLQYDFSKTIVLNQPFDANNPSRSMKYFDDPYGIFVDRDPRDLYVLVKKHIKAKGSFIPSDCVENFIAYHRLVRKRNVVLDNSNIMHISFEDMMYNYEKTSESIINFAGLNPAEQSRKKHFDPNVSINNTQLFLEYPELQEEINAIEQALPEYLYPFEKYTNKPSHQVKPF